MENSLFTFNFPCIDSRLYIVRLFINYTTRIFRMRLVIFVDWEGDDIVVLIAYLVNNFPNVNKLRYWKFLAPDIVYKGGESLQKHKKVGPTFNKAVTLCARWCCSNRKMYLIHFVEILHILFAFKYTFQKMNVNQENVKQFYIKTGICANNKLYFTSIAWVFKTNVVYLTDILNWIIV